MRRILAVCMVFVLLIGCLAGCSSRQESMEQAGSAEEQTQPEAAAPEVNEAVTEADTPQESAEEETGAAPAAEVVTAETEPTAEAKEGLSLPEGIASTFYFSSGAGGWGTELILAENGSFTGNFHDSDMGDIGEGYPNGTVYLCTFQGRFTVTEQMDEHSWRLLLTDLKQEQEQDAQWIEDEIRFIGSYPYGLEAGVDYILYSPDTPVEGLNEELISWWPGRFSLDGAPETLESWCIYSLEGGYGFFGYDA